MQPQVSIIIANYNEGDSQPTPEVCAAPDAGPMCPPENLVTNVEDGDTFVHLDWDAPNAGCEEEGGDDGGGFPGPLNDEIGSQSFDGEFDVSVEADVTGGWGIIALLIMIEIGAVYLTVRDQ